MAREYFYQGGQRIEVEHADDQITVQAASADEALRVADASGVELTDVEEVAPNLVRARIPAERDAGMDAMRQDRVLHHVYRSTEDSDNEYLITDTFFIKFKDSTTPQAMERYVQDEHLEVVRRVDERLYLVRVTDATGRNPLKAANRAARRDEVEYAEPNLVRELQRFAFIPSDTLFSRQWHLHAPSQRTDLVPGAGVFAPEAWDITRGVRDITVCVADDGFDTTHPDFQGEGKLVSALDASADSTGRVVFGPNVLPRAGDYHGTPCAGVAVAEQNGQGVVGVAPGCSLMAVRFPLAFDDDQMIQLFTRISREADVVSCSWGYGPAYVPMSTALRTKIAELARTGGKRGKGLVICIAAGNNNCPVKDLNNTRTYEYLDRNGNVRRHRGRIDRWIASHPDVITVSGCTSLKQRSCYSSWGKDIWVCAPTDNWDDMNQFNPRGLGVVTTDNEGFGAGSDFSPGRFTDRFGGTSSATPTVAGVCGLILSRNPTLTALDVRRILKETADKDLKIESENEVNEPGNFVDGFSLWYGHGKVNALKAVQAAAPEEEDIIDAVLSPNAQIPDAGAPIVSQLAIAEDGVVTELRIGLDIRHTYIGDLRVDIQAPDGTSVTLHNQTGGSANDLVKIFSPVEVPALRGMAGKSIRGVWTLRVTDKWRMDVGTLKSWRIAAKVTAAPGPAAPPQNVVRRRRGSKVAALATGSANGSDGNCPAPTQPR